MENRWTENQKKAIYAENKEVVVSASAGTGKTAVLTERITQKIINGGDIEQFALITFTRAAAAEMQTRIYKALKAAQKGYSDNISLHLRKQIALFPRANISTIDSFCQKLLRKYFFLVNISPIFQIADENLLALLASEAIDAVFAQEPDGLPELVEHFGGKFGDEDLKDYIIKIYNFSQNCANPNEWILKSDDEISRIIIEFGCEFAARKNEKNVLSFSDLSQKTIQLLSNNDINNFKEIYVDEFQDVSPAQAEIIRLLSEKSNIFMVGDVKQSIYAFRSAAPEIFECKIKNAGDNAVFLPHNFRSAPEIINTANHIFSVLMPNYAAKHKFISTKETRGTVQFHIIERGPRGTISAEDFCVVQARIVARMIKKMQNPQETAILLQNNKQVSIFTKTLIEEGVLAISEQTEKLFDTQEISLIKAFLMVVDNPLQDIPLIQTMKHIFQFTDIELYEMRKDMPNGYFYNAVANNQSEKSLNFVKTLNEYVNFAKTHSIYQLLERFLTDTNYEIKIARMPRAKVRLANIQIFRKFAAEFSKTNNLQDFIAYITACEERHSTFLATKPQNANAVQVMTIHKSKGLQFPRVFLPVCERTFDFPEARDKIVFDLENGIALDEIATTQINDETFYYKKNNPQKELILANLKNKNETRKAAIIIRCADTSGAQLYMVGGVTNIQKAINKWKKPKDYLEYSNFMDWLGISLINAKDKFSEIIFHENYPLNSENVLEKTSGEPLPVPDYLTYKIPENTAPLKASVSALLASSFVRKVLPEKYLETAVNENAILPTLPANVPKTSAFRGTVVHFFLANYNLDAKSPESELQRLVDEKYLRKNEASLINLQAIRAFFSSSLGQRLLAAHKLNPQNVQREVKFFTNYLHNDDELLLQGVVDCFFIEDGEIVLIDFKTGGKAGKKPQSKKQVEIYSNAIEKIFGIKVKENYVFGGL